MIGGNVMGTQTGQASLSIVIGAVTILGLSEFAAGADIAVPPKARIQAPAPIETWSVRLTPYV